MRLTSELFAAWLVRRVFSDGGFAAIARRGSDAAGAVFVVCRDRLGGVRLFGPAPQTLADEKGDRRFVREDAADEEALNRRFEREARFDPDFWVIEIETDDPERYLTVVAAD